MLNIGIALTTKVKVNVAVALPGSVAVTVTVYVPVTGLGQVTTPVDEFIVIPLAAGLDDTVYVNVSPSASDANAPAS